jgi:two-component system, chemotaxis family, protein-glutamate methylesterase/glutaminase
VDFPGHDVVVIGASAGGVQALAELIAQLPQDLSATLFIVLHRPPDGTSLLEEVLRRKSVLPVKAPAYEEPLERGAIYVAPSDHHLLVKPGHIRLTRGPRENRCRPAIDPLFRSAAVAYRSRVIGVLLTGLLDDGVSGLVAIQRCGGLTMVQIRMTGTNVLSESLSSKSNKLDRFSPAFCLLLDSRYQ